MGGLVESQVATACRAIIEQDTDAAARAVESDPRVDAMEREVEQFAIRLLALAPAGRAGPAQIVAR